MLEGYVREALFMLELGALPADVDGPMRAFGMPMGPLQMSDLAGNDIGHNVRKDFGWTFPSSALADKLVESGRLGRPDGRRRRSRAGSRTRRRRWRRLAEHSAAAGATRRPMGADEVLDRRRSATRCGRPIGDARPTARAEIPQPDAPPSTPRRASSILEEGIAQRES